MGTDPTTQAAPLPGDEASSGAPLAGNRSQAIQRLQIGVFGLAAMVLLVGLAEIIITNAEWNQARVVPEAAPTVAAEATPPPASDPLAEAGVVPDMPVQDSGPQQNGNADDAAP